MEEFFGDDLWGDEPEWALDHDAALGIGTDASDTAIPSLGAQHVLILVDCHEDMFVSDGNSAPSPMQLTLHLTERILRQRIQDSMMLKLGKRNGVGMILYDTKPVQDADADNRSDHEEDDDDDEESRRVHVLLNLEPPGMDPIKTIQACQKGDRDLKAEFASSSSSPDNSSSAGISPLQTALEESMRLFRQAKCVREASSNLKQPVDDRSIWILTNRHEPYVTSQQILLSNVAREARASGIDIVVWPLASPSSHNDSATNIQEFYEEIVSRPIFEKPLVHYEEIEEGLEDLQDYWRKIRRLYVTPLVFPGQTLEGNEEDLHIMVDWFRFIQIAKKPSTITIDPNTKREMIILKQYLDSKGQIFAQFRLGDAEDRKRVQPGLKRIRRFANLGGVQVPLSRQDLQDMRLSANGHLQKPQLRILGFHPLESLPWYQSMGPTYLLTPSEDIQGSYQAFAELYISMLRKRVLAVAEVLLRPQWSSKLVALTPLDSQSKDQNPEPPIGLMAITVPWEDDYRDIDDDKAYQMWLDRQANVTLEGKPDTISSHKATDGMGTNHGQMTASFPSEEFVEAAEQLVQRQLFSDMVLGRDFEDAALQRFIKYIEAVALEMPPKEGDDEEEEYDTQPDENLILQFCESQIEGFRQSLPEDIQVPKAGAKRKKEPLPQKSNGELDWEQIYALDRLQEPTAKQLKDYLVSIGERASGKKDVLVQRIKDAMEAGPDVKVENRVQEK